MRKRIALALLVAIALGAAAILTVRVAPSILKLSGIRPIILPVARPIYQWARVPQRYAAIRAAAVYMAGHSSDCTFNESIAAEKYGDEHYLRASALAGSYKLIRSESGLHLWQGSKGEQWWTSDKGTLPWLMAEQEWGIYAGVRKGDTVLDCGSHIGVFAREALNAGASRVVAIDPSPLALECLRRNFVHEISEGRVIVYPKGVWDKDDQLPLAVHQEQSGKDSFVLWRTEEHNNYLAPLTTIDKLVSELGLNRVDFIKMDIEGAETNALLGARETIHRFRPRMALSVYHRLQDFAEVPRIVKSYNAGYNVRLGPCITFPGELYRRSIAYFE